MIRRFFLLGLLAVGAVLLAACGGGGHGEHDGAASGAKTRTVEIDMVDIAYQPSSLTVTAGETVKFVFTNKGKIKHDAFIGDEAAQQEHEMQMRSGEAVHHEANAITVEPGKIGELTHTFKANEQVLIGCHEEGHYAAGMKIAVTIQ